MCGIVGVAGNLFKKDVDTFNDLLYMDALRGKDSTGVAAIKTDGNWDIIKNVGLPSDLMELKSYDRFVHTSARALIGHNRYGTMGAKTKANAHPFGMTNVVGVHNGTITDASKRAMKDGVDFGTDSEAVYYNIDWYGVENTIPKLEGAWALVFYHEPTNTLNFIRNDKRPLFYGFSDDMKQLYWASEAYMLRAAASRNGIKFREDKLFAFQEDTLYKFELTKGAASFEEPERVKLKGKEPVAYTVNRFPAYSPPGRAPTLPWTPPKQEATKKVGETDEIDWDAVDWANVSFDNNDPLAWHTNETYASWRRRVAELEAPKPVETPTANVPAVVTSNVVELRYRNPITRDFMTREEFDTITKHGCDWCNNNIEWGDKVMFIANSAADPECFCETCTSGTEISMYLKGA